MHLHDLCATATRDEVIPLCEGFQFHTRVGTNPVTSSPRPTPTSRSVRPGNSASRPKPKDQALLRTSLATMAEALRLAVALIQHVTPGTTEKVNVVLGYNPSAVWREELNWGTRLNGAKVAPALVLFPRPQPPAKV
jgi:methionyl-tRNA synthetase